MILKLKTSTTLPFYTMETVLDGVAYLLHFLWNSREEAWYLSLHDVDDDPIVSGVKVVADWPLLRKVTDERCPPGVLLAVDTTGDGVDPGLDELGARVVLQYVDAEELDQLPAEVA